MDTLTPQERSQVMSRIRSQDTKPEMLVRRIVHRAGYRYRLHCADLPGKPDLVFRSKKKIIFVHGCFWHAHPRCSHHRIPKSRLDFWKPKIAGNRKRDIRTERILKREGWAVEIVWECETTDAQALRRRVVRFLGD